tara:strand:- start:9189 stop:9533 length:345 start_codon:yes stop_codon:yes gene_type:complete
MPSHLASTKSTKAVMTSLRVFSHGKLYLEMNRTINNEWMYRQYDQQCTGAAPSWSQCRFTDNKGFVRDTTTHQIIHYPIPAISEPGRRNQKKRRKKIKRTGKLGTLWRQYKKSR